MQNFETSCINRRLNNKIVHAKANRDVDVNTCHRHCVINLYFYNFFSRRLSSDHIYIYIFTKSMPVFDIGLLMRSMRR